MGVWRAKTKEESDPALKPSGKRPLFPSSAADLPHEVVDASSLISPSILR